MAMSIPATMRALQQIRSFADPSLVTLFESWLDPSSRWPFPFEGSRRE
jgi:hypothetical protein